MRAFLLCLFLWTLAAGPTWAGYRDLGDGSVLDTASGLAWQLAAPTQTFFWSEALAYCENLTTGGHDDWRLPNIRELTSLLDYSRYMPTVDPRFAVAADDSRHWSSSSFHGSRDTVSVINIYYGFHTGAGKTKAGMLVRCVRDGSFPSPTPPAALTLLLLGQ